MTTDTKTDLSLIAEANIPVEKVIPQIHLGYLDSLRALAALYVVIVHCMTQVDPNGTILTGHARLIRDAFRAGHDAVDLFIVLSGFCLMLPVVKGSGLLRGGAFAFYKKRARRILPPYYLALVICLILIWFFLGEKTGSEWDHCLPVTRFGLLTHLFLVQEAFERSNAQINYALWSVSVEWHIYFFFPLLVLLWRKIGPLQTTVLAIIAGYVLLTAFRKMTRLDSMPNGVSPQFLGLFALGMLGAGITYSQDLLLSRLRRGIPWEVATVALAMLVAALRVINIHHGKPLEPSATDTVVGMCAISLLIASGRNQDGWIHRGLSWRPLAFLGTFAYSIYLMHPPILALIWKYVEEPQHLNGPFSLIVECFAVVPVTVALTYMFFLACERPFLNRPAVLDLS